jgi:hypothetical protein
VSLPCAKNSEFRHGKLSSLAGTSA